MQLKEFNNKNRVQTGGNPVISAAGFTLLETMVAVSIIAIVLVSIYKLHIQTISMNITAKFYATAPFLAQEKISELELSPAISKKSTSPSLLITMNLITN